MPLVEQQRNTPCEAFYSAGFTILYNKPVAAVKHQQVIRITFLLRRLQRLAFKHQYFYSAP